MAAAAVARKLLLLSLPFSNLSLKPNHNYSNLHSFLSATNFSTPISTTATSSASRSIRNCNKRRKVKSKIKEAAAAEEVAVKRRTRSDKEFDEEALLRYGDSATHIPVMLGEVLDVFASLPLRSFVDCTLGAAGHSSAIIRAHPEMELYVGLDVDPVALDHGQAQINTIFHGNSCGSNSELKAHTFLKNYRDIKDVLHGFDETKLTPSVDGILMDLGMSSMQVNNAERGFSVLSNGPLDMRMDPQASLKAEDILNSWPDNEVGRILRDYGEESNWYSLQKKIVKARLNGGLHSTGDLVRLIQSSTSRSKGGRQGWIKTATRVFQALRIAVNDELNTLKETICACFDCLAPGGRLAVISFHSLEDRIVKQTFLEIISGSRGGNDDDDEEDEKCKGKFGDDNDDGKEAWIKRRILGLNGTILTKRPITPSEEEERLNRRCRSAKLRAIQKL